MSPQSSFVPQGLHGADLCGAADGHVMRAEDPSLMAVWMKAWNDLAAFEIVEVRTSAEAAQAIAPQL